MPWKLAGIAREVARQILLAAYQVIALQLLYPMMWNCYSTDLVLNASNCKTWPRSSVFPTETLHEPAWTCHF